MFDFAFSLNLRLLFSLAFSALTISTRPHEKHAQSELKIRNAYNRLKCSSIEKFQASQRNEMNLFFVLTHVTRASNLHRNANVSKLSKSTKTEDKNKKNKANFHCTEQ